MNDVNYEPQKVVVKKASLFSKLSFIINHRIYRKAVASDGKTYSVEYVKMLNEDFEAYLYSTDRYKITGSMIKLHMVVPSSLHKNAKKVS